MNFTLKVDLRVIFVALLVLALVAMGMKLMAPSGQYQIVNNTQNCDVQAWLSQSAQGSTMDNSGKLLDLVTAPGEKKQGQVNGNDQWVSFVSRCPGVPFIPIASYHLIGPPAGDLVITVNQDASGKLSATGWEISGWYMEKKPLLGW